jgi:hypothetical protein
MTYVIQAIVARTNVLSVSAQQSDIIPLEQQFSMLLMTEALYDEVINRFEQSETPAGFLFLSKRVRDWLARYSTEGAIAYIETDIFGGYGSQSACVYEHGECVIAPFVTSFAPEANRMLGLALENFAINTALRRIGVVRTPGQADEFDSLGLGRHRTPEDWLQST